MPPRGTLRLVGPAGVDLRKLSARLSLPLRLAVRLADGRKAFRLGRVWQSGLRAAGGASARRCGPSAGDGLRKLPRQRLSAPLLLLLLVARRRGFILSGAKWKGPHWLDAAPASSAFGSTAAVGSRCAFG